jgi:hypothetical protein
VAKSIDLALQAEFSLEENEQLLREFIAKNFINSAGQPLPCCWAIHDRPDNPHAHIIFSGRADDGVVRDAETYFKRANRAAPERGGAAKDAAMKQRDWLINIRKNWANHCNEAFAAAGLDDRISPLSLAAQGQDRVPGQHLGPMLSRQQKLLNEIKELNAILATLEAPAPREEEIAPMGEVSPSPSPTPEIAPEIAPEDSMDDGYDSPAARRRRQEEEASRRARLAEIAAMEAVMALDDYEDDYDYEDDDYPAPSPTY